MVGWLVDWLVGWLVGWMVGWVGGWVGGGGVGVGVGVGVVVVVVTPAAFFLGSVVAENRPIGCVFACFYNSRTNKHCKYRCF